mgnify:CR=1 FL=1
MRKEVIKAKYNTVHLSTENCIDKALFMIGKTREEILKDVEKEKKIENEVMEYYENGKSTYSIQKKMNIKLSKVKHIIQFDRLGLSYRKVGKKSN